MDFGDLQGDRAYTGALAYNHSKLADGSINKAGPSVARNGNRG